MKVKKVLEQLVLLLTFMGLATGMQVARADTLQPLTTDSGVYGRNTDFVLAKGDSVPFGTSKYPEIGDVSANGVVNGRITNKTTQFKIMYDGTATTTKGRYGTFYTDVIAMVDGKPKSLATTTPTTWTITNSGQTATPPTTGIIFTNTVATTINVDLSQLGTKIPLPIYIGFSYVAPSSTEWVHYGDMALTAASDAVSKMADVTINKGADLPSASTTITGTGESGTTVTLSGESIPDNKYTTTVDANGNYSISLGAATLKSLGNMSSVKVTESNQFGDAKSATANVSDSLPLTISPATSTVSVTPDEWTDHITGKSSADIADWLAEQAGLTVTKQGDPTALTKTKDGLVFNTSTTADTLSSVMAGGNTSVAINAKDSAGDTSTSDATINVLRSAGQLQFGTYTSLEFGSKSRPLPIPNQSTLIAPNGSLNTDGSDAGAYSVHISDTRAKGSPWYLAVQATPLTDGSDHTLSLVYADGEGHNQTLDDSLVKITSGTRSSDDTHVASDWEHSGQQYPGNASDAPTGIYLQAQPNIYAGGGQTANYSGNMTWWLNNTPY